MNGTIIRTLVLKDLTLYFRNRFFALITVLGLVAYILFYLVMPATVDEEFSLALVAPGIPEVLLNVLSNNQFTLENFETEAALQEAVLNGDYPVGMVLQPDTIQQVLSGTTTDITVYVSSQFPSEFQQSLETVLRQAFNELAYTLSGQPLNVTFDEQVLGPDMLGQQIPLRDRMLPLFAVFTLIMETLGLASLISDEIEHRTLRALLITPATTGGLFVAKAIMGIGLAFSQAAILMAVTGGLNHEPALVLLVLLAGALLATAVGFLIATVAKDMLSVIAWGVLVILVLVLPAFTILFPGTVSSWVQVIPSYYLIDTIHQVVNFGAGWADVGMNLVILAVIGAVLLGAGSVILGRKVTQ